MQITYNNLSLNISLPGKSVDSQKIPLILLHGFTSSLSSWNFVQKKLDERFLGISIDILGHGESSSPEDWQHYTEASLVEQLDYILTSLNISRSILCGYSMGGRLAMSYTVSHPEKVIGLILESTTPGIEQEEQRKERVKNDERLAKKILEEGAHKFMEYWLSIPMFDTLKKLSPRALQQLLRDRGENNPVGLANSLRGFSTGRMTNHWENLNRLNIPALLITGKNDLKFTEINKRLHKSLPSSTHKIVDNCGHNVHLENPQEFFILVSSFLKNF